jgi:hypothetical protein
MGTRNPVDPDIQADPYGTRSPMRKDIEHVVQFITGAPPMGRDQAAWQGGCRQAGDDSHLLDAYSRAVVSVVDRVGPTVVSISTGRPDREGMMEQQGAGSGVILTPDGFISLPNHHHGSPPPDAGEGQGEGDMFSSFYPLSLAQLLKSFPLAARTPPVRGG